MPAWKKVITSGSNATLNTLTVSNGITGSLLGTAATASSVSTLNQNVNITGSLSILSTFATSGNPLEVKNSGYFNAYFQGTAANNQASFYLDNNRGSFASYGGFLYGGSTSNLGNLFGVSRADKLMMFADGVSNLGFYVGTLTSQPFVIGTNNTERMRIVGTGNIGIGKTTPSVPLDIVGTTYVTGSLAVTAAIASTNVTSSFARISGSGNLQQTGPTLAVYGSGSGYPVFTVQGSQGELFSVSDSLTGSLFSVSDISGLPILEVFSDDTIVMGDYQAPSLYATKRYVSTVGVNNIYSIPTSSYNGAFFDYVITSASNARAGNITAIALGTSIQYNETTTMDIGNTSGVNFMVRISGNDMVLTGSFTTANWVMKTIIRSI